MTAPNAAQRPLYGILLMLIAMAVLPFLDVVAKFLGQMGVPVLQEPVKLSRTPLTIRRRAPTLGEHTDQILQELGYGAADIARLRTDRVV